MGIKFIKFIGVKKCWISPTNWGELRVELKLYFLEWLISWLKTNIDSPLGSRIFLLSSLNKNFPPLGSRKTLLSSLNKNFPPLGSRKILLSSLNKNTTHIWSNSRAFPLSSPVFFRFPLSSTHSEIFGIKPGDSGSWSLAWCISIHFVIMIQPRKAKKPTDEIDSPIGFYSTEFKYEN